MGDKIANIAAAIVTVAMVTTIVARPNSAKVIEASGNAFANGIRAALGR